MAVTAIGSLHVLAVVDRPHKKGDEYTVLTVVVLVFVAEMMLQKLPNNSYYSSHK